MGLWAAISIGVAVFAFAVGIAFSDVYNRLSFSEPTPTALYVAVAGTTTPVGVQAPMLTATVTALRSPTATPTASPMPTATPTCSSPVDSLFASLYEPTQFGCTTSEVKIIWAAWEPFEHGAMLWRSDTDSAYVFSNDGRWFKVDERWNGSAPSDRGTPPAGLQAPVRAALGMSGARATTFFPPWVGQPTKKRDSVRQYRHSNKALFCKAAMCLPARATISIITQRPPIGHQCGWRLPAPATGTANGRKATIARPCRPP